MLRNYYKYLPWLILAAFVSYGGATHYAQTTFDLFYLTTIFMIVYVALLYLHEHYLKYKYKDLFIRIMSNSIKINILKQKEVGKIPTSLFYD